MLSFLYFLSYSPLLSSFPTRRSSDLAARCGDPLLVIGPERVQPCQVVGARLRRHAVANERLHEGFVLADAEYRSEEHTSELQSRFDLVCRLLLEKKKKKVLKKHSDHT